MSADTRVTDLGVSLAQVLAELRQQTRLSQTALARLSGVSRAIVGLIERSGDSRGSRSARPTIETLRRLARGLATDPENEQLVDGVRADRLFHRLMMAAGYPRLEDTVDAASEGIESNELDAILLDRFGKDLGGALIEAERALGQLSAVQIRALAHAISGMVRGLAAKAG
ncbi:MAG: helix-turn-helix transcriptional regulator [Chloroflexota bacterium]